METPESHYADVRIVRQPLRAQSPGGAALAAGPPAVRAALRPDLLLLDQPGRAMAGRPAATMPGARRVLLARRAHHRARRLDQAMERTRPALQMDQDRRPDHRPHLPLLLTHLRTWTLDFPDPVTARIHDRAQLTFNNGRDGVQLAGDLMVAVVQLVESILSGFEDNVPARLQP